ncbi:sigma factor-like helix-turn-helix DNA-binding protein [Actinokineospora soli]|uniref:Sigma factor-like helix-turn-helix DNA-binding protein n=1 Tax=Actinokineospora soli TaxID=1048753 RepID=A0ABW2TSN1_9PSEU
MLPAPTDPALEVEERAAVRYAFVVALQALPPRQRAVLLLRDVLGWSAAEVAGLLSSSVASVNSALQRARAGLVGAEPVGEPDQAVLDAYCAAFLAHDVDAVVSLLHADVTMSMPPFQWWLRGRSDVALALEHGSYCDGHTLVPVSANGAPAFVQYDAAGEAFALVVVSTSGGAVVGTTTWLVPELVPLFGLPMSSGSPVRSSGYGTDR